MMIQFDEHAFKLVEATILGEMMIQFDKHIFEKLGWVEATSCSTSWLVKYQPLITYPLPIS